MDIEIIWMNTFFFILNINKKYCLKLINLTPFEENILGRASPDRDRRDATALDYYFWRSIIFL
jgi:hypothetical protein